MKAQQKSQHKVQIRVVGNDT